MLTARNALHANVVCVHDEARPAELPEPIAGDVVYAVFAADAAGREQFRGLVTRGATAAHPGRIFADHLPPHPVPGVTPETPLGAVRTLLEHDDTGALAVLDGTRFHGAVTRLSVLDAFVRNDRELRQTLDRSVTAAIELAKLAAWHTIEADRLQRGIEILARLIGARYGAIGIINSDGALAQFIHTGISPELAARIGRLPEGKGLLGVVIHENHTLRLDDIGKDPRAVGFPPNHPPMKSLLAVPVTLDGAVYGRVYLSEKTDGTSFSDEDEQLVTRFADTLALTLHFHRGETERRRAHAALREVADAVSTVTGEAFFPTLVLQLGMTLQLDYVFVGEVSTHDERIIATIAFGDHGKIADNIEYQLVSGTACGSVGCKAVCYLPEGAQKLHPEDELLNEFGVEAFVGYPLLDSAGTVLGLLAVMHSRPIHNHEHIQSVLRICAARAAAELERRRTDQARRHAEEALRASEEDLRALAENANDGILVNCNGQHVFANRRLAELLGYSADELRHTGMKELVHPEEYEQVAGRFRARMAGEPVPSQYETVFVARNGAAVPVEINATRTVWQGQPAGLVFIRDIRERKRAEQALHDRTAQLQAITDAMGAYLEFSDWQQASAMLVRFAIEQTQSGYGFAGVLTEGNTLRVLAHAGVEWHAETNRAFYEQALQTYEKIGYLEFTNFNNLFGHVITSGNAVISNDPASDPRAGGLPPGHPPLTSFLGVPMRRGDQTVGLLGVANHAGGYSETDRTKLEILTRIAGVLYDSYRRQQREVALRQEHATAEAEMRQLASAVEQTADSVLITDADGVIQYVNPGFEQITGYSRAEAVGRKPNLVKSGRHDAAFYQHLWSTIRRGEPYRNILINRRKDGELYWEQKTITPLKNERGEITRFVSTGKDITAHIQAEGLVTRLGRILDGSANEIYVFDAQTLRFIQVNKGARRNLGYDIDELRRMTPLDLKPDFDPARFEALVSPLRDGREEVLEFETAHRRKDGTQYPVEVRLQYSRAEEPPVFVAIILDVSERKRHEERLNYLAYHDSLTGLPNRARLLERIAQALAEADRHERLVAVLLLDLDRFKNVNDTLGHEAGDRLLGEVARRLSACVRPDDTVARLSGDEFTVVLADVAHVDDVARVARKILERFQESFRVNGQELFVTTSIGITLYPFDDRDPTVLLRNADTAMYHAKDSGRNTFRFYTAELNERLQRQLTLETALRQAQERGEFFLHYQPQVDLVSGAVTGVEALIRWRRGDQVISPLEFISLAEDTGLIVPIGEWVLREACADLARWHETDLPRLRMAVNLSARQFREPGLAETIERVLAEHGIAADRLAIEITESAIMHDPGAALATLERLSALGVHLAVDDFGTGYSSLSYLKRFPIDSLKIDKSFVHDITTDPDDAAITQAVIRLAHSLGIKVVAEGVETEAQLAFLQRRGCDAIQGFYFSKPLPAAELARLLYENRKLQLPREEVNAATRTLLIVDDEENIRKALLRALRGEGYRILTADGPTQAFEALARHPVGVILCDQRMPEMTGTEFLGRVRAMHPDTVRIVLSGYTELRSVTDAINRGAVYKFLTKPWEDDLLRDNLREAFRYHSLLTAAADRSSETPLNG